MKIKMFSKIYTNTVEFIQEDIVNKFKSKEEQYFYEQFNQYLDVEEALFCYQLLDEGLKATSHQKSRLEKILIKKITNNDYSYQELKNINSVSEKNKIIALIHSTPRNYVVYNDLKNKEYISSHEKYVMDFCSNYKVKDIFLKRFKNTMSDLKDYYKSGLDSSFDFYRKSYAENEKVRTEVEKTLYLCALLVKHDLLKPQEMTDCKEQVVDVCNYFIKQTGKRYASSSFDRIGKISLDYFIDSIENMHKEYLSKNNKKEHLMNQLKRYQAKNKSLNEEIKDLINKEEYAIENLPLEAKKKIDKINKVAQELNDNEVNNFLHERLPIILKKYFSIDEEYRTKLKSVEGFNAEELMVQSLHNIEKVIMAKKEDSNYDLLSELSVENRKLKIRNI